MATNEPNPRKREYQSFQFMGLSEFVKAWSLGFRLQRGVPDHSNVYLRGLSVKASTNR